MRGQAQATLSSVKFDSGSFKDPSSRVFYFNQHVYRLINGEMLAVLENFYASKAFAKVKDDLVPTEIVDGPLDVPQFDGKVLRHKKIENRTFCYEWTPEQLKASAVLTLDLQMNLIKHGFTLKDATPFNILFENCRPLFIDIPSIIKHEAGTPWAAFNEYVENFFYPLLCAHYLGIDMGKLTLGAMGKLTLEETYALLHRQGYVDWKVWKYVRLPYFSRGKNKAVEDQASTVEEIILKCKELKKLIVSLKFGAQKEGADDSADALTYSVKDKNSKAEFIHSYLKNRPEFVRGIDVGAHTGEYAKILSKYARSVLAVESNIHSCNQIYKDSLINKLNIETCVMDFSRPTPAMGWAHLERPSFMERYQNADVLLALAVVHHLRFTHNVPLDFMFKQFSLLGKKIVVEWVPLTDPMLSSLLKGKLNHCPDYTEANFVQSLSRYYKIEKSMTLAQGRVLFAGERI